LTGKGLNPLSFLVGSIIITCGQAQTIFNRIKYFFKIATDRNEYFPNPSVVVRLFLLVGFVDEWNHRDNNYVVTQYNGVIEDLCVSG
jgi:hypothetical protein